MVPHHNGNSLGHNSQPPADLIKQGDPTLAHSHPSLEPFWPICESVYVQEGVLLYQDRVIIPLSLRRQVLQHLPPSTSTMEQRTRAIVFWPGCQRTFVTPEKHAQTATGMHLHKQLHLLSHLHLCHMVVISIL